MSAIDVFTRRPAWMADARCREHPRPGDAFFPDPNQYSRVDYLATMRAYCGGCLVVAECRAWAIAEQLPDGWAGGMSPRERRRAAGIPRGGKAADWAAHGTSRYNRGCRCDTCRVAKLAERRAYEARRRARAAS